MTVDLSTLHAMADPGAEACARYNAAFSNEPLSVLYIWIPQP